MKKIRKIRIIALCPQAWARGGGHLLPLWKCCKVFLCISSYSKTLSRPVIYALFSQSVVGFWGLYHQTPSLDPWWLSSPDPLICSPLEKSCGRPYSSIHPMYNVNSREFQPPKLPPRFRPRFAMTVVIFENIHHQTICFTSTVCFWKILVKINIMGQNMRLQALPDNCKILPRVTDLVFSSTKVIVMVQSLQCYSWMKKTSVSVFDNIILLVKPWLRV